MTTRVGSGPGMFLSGEATGVKPGEICFAAPSQDVAACGTWPLFGPDTIGEIPRRSTLPRLGPWASAEGS